MTKFRLAISALIVLALGMLIGSWYKGSIPFDDRRVDHAYLKEEALSQKFDGFMPPFRLHRDFSVKAFRWDDGLDIRLELNCCNNGQSVNKFESKCQAAASNYIAAVDQLYTVGFDIQTWSGTLPKNYTAQVGSGGRSQSIRMDLSYVVSFDSLTSPATFQVRTISRLSDWPNPGDVWVGMETFRSLPMEQLPRLMIILNEIAAEVEVKYEAMNQ